MGLTQTHTLSKQAAARWIRSRSVSYTHLDVYKRQQLNGAGLIALNGINFQTCHQGPELVVVIRPIRPVSYTHLDVYKRQLLALPLLWLFMAWNDFRRDMVDFFSSSTDLFLVLLSIFLLILQMVNLSAYYRWRRHSLASVSYTQLDVYKRQGLGIPIGQLLSPNRDTHHGNLGQLCQSQSNGVICQSQPHP